MPASSAEGSDQLSLHWFRMSDVHAAIDQLERKTLSDPPVAVPIFRAQSLSVAKLAYKPPSCVQIDRRGIYLAYSPGTPEGRLGENYIASRWDRTAEPRRPGDWRLFDPGSAIRMWNFVPADDRIA